MGFTKKGAYERGKDAYRCKDAVEFGNFVDWLLEDGDIVFRSCYEPKNDYFRGRSAANSKCKILKLSRPVLAFDDHDADWEVDAGSGQVVHVEAPSTKHVTTDFVTMLE